MVQTEEAVRSVSVPNSHNGTPTFITCAIFFYIVLLKFSNNSLRNYYFRLTDEDFQSREREATSPGRPSAESKAWGPTWVGQGGGQGAGRS